jgi:DNA-binding transcriptional LysR family regulator
VIWPDPLAIVVGHDHPLAEESRVTLPQLADYPAILPAKGTYTRELLESDLVPGGLTLKVGMTTNYLETIKMMVSVGLGWSVLPLSMMSEELLALEVDAIELARQLGVVRHRSRTLSNAARAMLDTLHGQ